MLGPAGSFLVRLLWPDRCAACGVEIAEAQVFCPACEVTVLPIDAACPGCALPLEGQPQDGRCRGCSARPFPFSAAMAGLLYGGAVAEAIIRYKHARGGRQLPLARSLGRCLVPLLDWAIGAGVDALLPVPLHRARLRHRGFNQSLELLREGVRHRRRRRPARPPPVWPSTLVRQRDTPPLGHEPPSVRSERLRGAFAVAEPGRVHGRRLLLVDDVMTTGATVAECARTLLAAGAKEIFVGALARAVGDHRLAPRVPP